MTSQKRFGVGVIGSGFGGRVIVPCLKAVEGFEIVAFCSRRKEEAIKEIGEYGIRNIIGSVDELLAVKGLDLVCIALPPFLHAEAAIKSINAGKHVLCEKPMARNVKEAEMMYQAAKGKNGIYAIDHQLRFQPNIQKMKSLINAGEIGEVLHVELTYNTAVWADANIPWSWWCDESLGGGELLALGSHWVDLLMSWFGDVKSVGGVTKIFHKERKGETGQMKKVTSDEYMDFTLEFSNGVSGHIIASCVASADTGLVINVSGQNGSLVLNGFNQLTLIKDKKQEDVSVKDPLLDKPVIGFNSWRTALVYYGNHIQQALEGKVKFEGATFNDGLKVQAVLDAMRKSSLEQKEVALN